ncbi:hypothetical protein VE02_08282 [Pseudogymnoascus sp. 03VT05]|nr:hypothetical protein VE02_08282 [Pseudogymnoascus sp. 03VT05]
MPLPPFLPTPSDELGRRLGLTGYKDFAYEFENKDALWAHAASDPAALSDDDRRVVLRRPPAETEEGNVKRVTDGHLTIGMARAAAESEVWEAEMKALDTKLLTPPDWIQRLNGDWGFAFYRCQETAPGNKGFWRRIEYMENRKRDTQNGLHAVPGGKEAFATRQLQFVDMIDSENNTLEYRQNFRTFRDMGLCGPGILKNTLLLITPESMDSSSQGYRATRPPDRPLHAWVWALDPDWKSQHSDEDGYEGKVRVSWSHLYSWFYMVRSDDRLTFKDLWRKAEKSGGVWSVPVD